MAETFEHLPLPRLEPVNPRRKKGGFGGAKPPANPQLHAEKLLDELQRVEREEQLKEQGFDPRLLLKLKVEGISPEALESIDGIRLVSQEQKSLLVVFLDEKAKGDFETRLATLKRGATPSRQDILFAIKGIENWSRKDRVGPALAKEGLPSEEVFLLDVELWSLERGDERVQLLAAFEQWASRHQIQILDKLNRETVLLARVRAGREGADALLNYRDVRVVDLPPQIRLNLRLLGTPLAEFGNIPAPPEDAPVVAVLDSGVVTGHPVLAPAIGDSQSFITGKAAFDEHGHGTMVGGIALYGDVGACVERRRFLPELRLVSGRITNELNECEGLVERQISEAVETFVRDYGCRVFNLSIGNALNPYSAGHVGPWASLLDELARLHKVLFVVSAGNFHGTANTPADWRAEYPDYLLSDDARIIDPAPALNALTVGSLARFEVSRMAGNFPHDPAHQPIARKDEPSPFTRCGPSVGNAIKPEVVEYGGNCYVDLRVSAPKPLPSSELGEISTAMTFAGGNLFALDIGTSFAAPKVAHLAGQLSARYPSGSAQLLRALIVAHSSVPEATAKRLSTSGERSKDELRVRRLVGYGLPDTEGALGSTERRVTLWAETELEEDSSQFYEVPLPEDFLKDPATRPRRVTVALAHAPLVRRTRLDYKASDLSFRVVRAPGAEQVFHLFKRADAKTKQDKLPPEPGEFRPSASLRSNGTVQAGTWNISRLQREWRQQKLFVVVTRSVPGWAKGRVEKEPYALVVVLEDKSNEEVRLYSQLRAQLQVRERARARVAG